MVLALAFTGCVATPVGPGLIITSVEAPLLATSATVDPATMKIGRAKSWQILGLVAGGDSSIQAAAAGAGIGTIQHVDYKSWSFLFVYSTFEVIVYGE
jgi:hypothetical protein